jgi:competence protein ComEA
MWKKVLREYFAFPKKERRAIWVLFLIWLVLIIVQINQKSFYKFNSDEFSYSIVYNKQVKQFDDSAMRQETFYKFDRKSKLFRNYFKYISEKQLLDLGLTKDETQTIVSLREAGLKIYTEYDLDTASILSDRCKTILKQGLKFFPSKKLFRKNEANILALSTSEKIELNRADTLALDAIKGVGLGMAKRILKYRERLGGFKNKEQLKEVWGMDSSTYENILKNIQIDKQVLIKLNINTADLKSLGQHPYIGYSLAKLIVNYRAQHGNYKNIRDLMNIHVMNEEIFSKIEDYISIEND